MDVNCSSFNKLKHAESLQTTFPSIVYNQTCWSSFDPFFSSALSIWSFSPKFTNQKLIAATHWGCSWRDCSSCNRTQISAPAWALPAKRSQQPASFQVGQEGVHGQQHKDSHSSRGSSSGVWEPVFNQDTHQHHPEKCSTDVPQTGSSFPVQVAFPKDVEQSNLLWIFCINFPCFPLLLRFRNFLLPSPALLPSLFMRSLNNINNAVSGHHF